MLEYARFITASSMLEYFENIYVRTANKVAFEMAVFEKSEILFIEGQSIAETSSAIVESVQRR